MSIQIKRGSSQYWGRAELDDGQLGYNKDNNILKIGAIDETGYKGFDRQPPINPICKVYKSEHSNINNEWVTDVLGYNYTVDWYIIRYGDSDYGLFSFFAKNSMTNITYSDNLLCGKLGVPIQIKQKNYPISVTMGRNNNIAPDLEYSAVAGGYLYTDPNLWSEYQGTAPAGNTLCVNIFFPPAIGSKPVYMDTITGSTLIEVSQWPDEDFYLLK